MEWRQVAIYYQYSSAIKINGSAYNQHRHETFAKAYSGLYLNSLGISVAFLITVVIA